MKLSYVKRQLISKPKIAFRNYLCFDFCPLRVPVVTGVAFSVFAQCPPNRYYFDEKS